MNAINRILGCLALIVMFSGLSGCAAVDAVNQAKAENGDKPLTPLQFVAALQVATKADAQAALANATRVDDQDAMACWTTVIAVVDEKAGKDAPPSIQIVGPLSAYQQGRNVVRGIQNQGPLIDPRIRRDCAVLVLDFERAILRGGIRAGVGFLLSPAVPVLGAGVGAVGASVAK